MEMKHLKNLSFASRIGVCFFTWTLGGCDDDRAPRPAEPAVPPVPRVPPPRGGRTSSNRHETVSRQRSTVAEGLQAADGITPNLYQVVESEHLTNSLHSSQECIETAWQYLNDRCNLFDISFTAVPPSCLITNSDQALIDRLTRCFELTVLSAGGDQVLTKNVLDMSSWSENQKLLVFGDLHDKLGQVQNIFRSFSAHSGGFSDLRDFFAAGHSILFLGDLMDLGPHSIEIIVYAMSLKIAEPGNVLILRGNHENALKSVTSASMNIAKAFQDVFANDNTRRDLMRFVNFRFTYNLPFFAILSLGESSEKMLAVHGGPMPNFDFDFLYDCGFQLRFPIEYRNPTSTVDEVASIPIEDITSQTAAETYILRDKCSRAMFASAFLGIHAHSADSSLLITQESVDSFFRKYPNFVHILRGHDHLYPGRLSFQDRMTTVISYREGLYMVVSVSRQSHADSKTFIRTLFRE